MASARKETERTKFIQDKCQTLLTQMLRDEDNKYCVDCDAKGPRWASWNLGVFLCIRCAGIHRNLGVHISRVRSVNLDTWSPEQVVSLQNMGNSRARAVYEAQLPDGFRRPQTDSALETFIRAKYEHKKYMAREWVPQPPAVANWDKEIDDEMEQLKRAKKKTSGVGSSGSSPFGALPSSISEGTSRRSAVNSSVPAVLAKPAPSPKSTRAAATAAQKAATAAATAAAAVTAQSSSSASSDLLGLSLPVVEASNSSNGSANFNTSAAASNADDLFSNFLSAPPAVGSSQSAVAAPAHVNGGANNTTAPANSSLAEQEADFFNQVAPTEQEKGKMTRDSILALYGQAPATPMAAQFNGVGAPANGGFGQFNMAPVNPQQQHLQMGSGGAFSAFSNAQLLGGQQFGGVAAPAAQPNNSMFAAFGNNGAFNPTTTTQQQQPQPSFAQFPPIAAHFGGNGLTAAAPSTNTAALNQKMNTLNLGNVWQ